MKLVLKIVRHLELSLVTESVSFDSKPLTSCNFLGPTRFPL